MILGREDPFFKHERNMSVEEFEEAIAAGEKLVVLDEVVLDISKYIDFHPGGKFVLEHNIG